MASKGGKHRSKKSSSRRYKKTQGGTSQRNYSKKQKNLDYRYRVLDNQDASQSNWYISTTTMYNKYMASVLSDFNKSYPELLADTGAKALITQVQEKGYNVFCQYLSASCQFIPLSTSQMVSKNMTVEVKSRYPFAYCVFQNTSTFKSIFQKYLTTSILEQTGGTPGNFMDYVKSKWPNRQDLQDGAAQLLGWFDLVYGVNTFGNDDGGFSLPMMQSGGADLNMLIAGTEVTSTKWSQICRAQSSYREVKTPTNGGEFTANINVYYSRATQFLTGDTSRNTLSRGYKYGALVQTNAKNLNNIGTFELTAPYTTEAYKVMANLYGSSYNVVVQQNYDTIFRSGDMILCILPTWYFDTVTPQTSGYVYRPYFPQGYVDTSMIPTYNILRHYYILNQDVGLQDVDKTATVASYNIANYYNTTTLGFATMGNSLALSNKLVRNIYNRSRGIQVFPLLREEIDSFAQQANCIVVDEKCYDETNQELEMVAYMDCQPVPANVGSQLLENIEGGDTMNCNAIVSCGNKTDSETLLDATVSNTGPSIVEVTDQTISLTDDSTFFLDSHWYSTIGPCIGETGSSARFAYYAQNNLVYDQVETQQYAVRYLTDTIQSYVNMINTIVNFQLIITGTYQDTLTSQWQGSLDEADGCQYFGFEPTGLSNQTFIRVVIPCGFYNASQGSTTVPSHYYYKVYSPATISLLLDAAEPGQVSLSIPPAIYEFITSLMIIPIAEIYGQTDNQVYKELSFADIGVYDNLNPDDQGYLGVAQEQPIAINVYDYFKKWLMEARSNVLYASKAWKKIKGFFSKVVKFIKNKALPFFKKVTDTVAPIVPAPYGTVITGIGTGVSTIQTALNLIGAKKNSETNPAAQGDDAVTDTFTVIPQYRLSDSTEPADISAAGSDWVDGDQMLVNVDSYGNTVSSVVAHKLSRHPQYLAIKRRLAGVKLNGVEGVDVASYCQQRIKVIFRKTNVPPDVAKGYKAVLALGSDTQYLSDSDYQQQDTNVSSE